MNLTTQPKEKEILRAASFVLEKEITTLADLTDNQLVFFSSFSSNELNRYFAIQDAMNGKSYREVAQRYGLSKSKVERLCI
jgi:Mor family transcriptional regulator